MADIAGMLERIMGYDEGLGGEFQGLTGEWSGIAEGATAKIQELEELNQTLEAQIRELKAKNYDAMMSMPMDAPPEAEAEPEAEGESIFESEEN